MQTVKSNGSDHVWLSHGLNHIMNDHKLCQQFLTTKHN